MDRTHRPLGGKGVLLTREHSQAAALAEMLREQGASPVACPLIAFRPPEDWGPVDRCLGNLDRYHGFLFTSVNAVSFFFDRMETTGTGTLPIKRGICFAVGPATARALEAKGIPVKAVPDRYQAEGLVDLLDNEDLRGKRFLFPRARSARDVLTRYLEERRVAVDLAVVYETRKAGENEQHLQAILAARQMNYITFTSTSTVRFFGEMAGPQTASSPWQAIPAACIGEITSRAAVDLGFRTVLTAPESTLQGLVGVLVQHAGRKRGRG